MAVTSTTQKVSLDGDGATTAFPFAIYFLDDAHVSVTHVDSDDVETSWVLGTHYTLTGEGDVDGGTLTVKTSPTDYTPASGEKIVIERVVPYTQPTTIATSGPLAVSTLQLIVDRATMIIQQLKGLNDRTMKVPVGEAAGVSLAMPTVSDRASKFLSFNASGEPIAAAGDVGSVSVSTYMEGVLDDTTAAAARRTLGWAKGADIASSAALTLGSDGNYFDVTGTTAITSIGTVGIGEVIKLHFDGALTLTHHATDLVLPGGANITTAAGDEAEFVEYASGDWRCTNYVRASGNVDVSADIVHVGDTNNKIAFGTDTQDFQTGGTSRLDISDTGVRLGAANARVTTVLDEDNMASDSATALATQQSIKAYVDAHAIVQSVSTQTGAVATGTTTMPWDDTIPQNTEGDEYMTLAITPTNSSNILEIDVVINVTCNSNLQMQAALFQDSTAGALASGISANAGNGNSCQVVFRHRMTAGTASATTFKVRAGAQSANTTTFNGSGGARIHGGVLASSITIKELRA